MDVYLDLSTHHLPKPNNCFSSIRTKTFFRFNSSYYTYYLLCPVSIEYSCALQKKDFFYSFIYFVNKYFNISFELNTQPCDFI